MTKLYPLISIIIPVYNHADYILETLQSIYHDDYPNKELVLINDGSTDNSDTIIRDWIKEHKNKLKIIYKSRANKGLTATMNELFSLSSGAFIVDIASDDFLLEGGIFKRYRYLEEHPEKLAVFGDCIVVDENSKKISESALFSFRKFTKENLSTDKGLRKEFITSFAMPGPVLMVKRDIYDLIGGYDEEATIEDLDFFLKMAAQNLLGFLDEKVSAYRIHSTNMSGENSGKMLQILRDSRNIYLRNFKYFSLSEKGMILWQVVKLSVRMLLLTIKRDTNQ